MDVSRIRPVAPGPTAAPVRIAPHAPAPAVRTGGAKPSGLWDLLTPEEQAFFASETALGPLTYGPARGPAPSPRGGRIDVKG